MKNYRIKLCSVLLSVMMLTSMPVVPNVSAIEVSKNEVFTVTEDENGIHFTGPTGDKSAESEMTYDAAKVIETVEDYYSLSNGKTAGKNILLKSSATLPESVDNSKSEYFPEIGNQGDIGSCGCWANTYYQFTYTMNKEMGVKTTPENTFSPKWVYNLLNGGEKLSGTINENVNELMKDIGNVTLSQVPYDDDYLTWSPEEEIWREALSFRVKDYYEFENFGVDSRLITSVDDEDIAAVKSALADGEVLTFSTYIYDWSSVLIKTNENAPENDLYADEYIVKSMDGTNGGHRMTIVGYNDNIWTDINENDIVDAGEMGALKIANSWGDGFANDGFTWIAYDALNEVSCVDSAENAPERCALMDNVNVIEVMPYSSADDIYLKYTLNSSYRGSIRPYLIAEKDGSVYSEYIFPNTFFIPSVPDERSFDGTEDSNDGTLLFPLDNIVSDISSENLTDYTWSVKFADVQADGKVLTVKEAEIIDESANVVYGSSDAYPVELDGDEVETVLSKSTLNHAVVYYRGYENPQITYKEKDGSWKTSEMEENVEREGYVHKYVIDLGTAESTMIYFSDIVGNVDDNNGEYYTAFKDLNYYATESVRAPVAASLVFTNEEMKDVNTGCKFEATATGGFEPYLYQFITENLDTGEVFSESYMANPISTYYPRAEGNYRLTLNVKDYSGEVATVYYDYRIEDKPFEIMSYKAVPGNNILTGQRVDFSAKTRYEGILFFGYVANTYDVSVEKNGIVCYSENIKAVKSDDLSRCSDISFSWTPMEAGEYTAKLSTTDADGVYRESEVSFEVFEFDGTITGDSDNSGVISVTDATLIQKYCSELTDDNSIWKALADCDRNNCVNIKDATHIQRYLVFGKSDVFVGEINRKEPEPTTKPTTEPVTEPTTAQPTTVAPTTVQPTTVAETNTVVFTNSLNWSGTISCYYWSDSNTSMTSWPGKAMSYTETNSYGQKQYSFDLPDGATYVIFTNGSSQTEDISYPGGEVRYYALSSTDSKGHYNVSTW